MYKAFVVRNQHNTTKSILRIYHITSKAHATFQLPVNVQNEDPNYPVTGYKKVSVQDCPKHYQIISNFMLKVQDIVYRMDSMFLNKDLCGEFIIDTFEKLWVTGIYSEEYSRHKCEHYDQNQTPNQECNGK